jgi:hypothetical protein
MVRYLEVLIEDCLYLSKFRTILEPLNILLKVLTLDSPADFKRYSISSAVVGEEIIRKVMSRRKDFQIEVVNKLRIF